MMTQAECSKLAVLISGNGSNLGAILDHIEQGKLPAEVSLVISNKADAYGLVRAEQAGIKTLVLENKTYATRQEYDHSLIRTLEECNPDLIVLAGFMRILGPGLVTRFQGRIVNIHPSYLPALPGLHSIERAVKEKHTFTGVTVHYVDHGMDTGPIIMQEKVDIDPQDTPESLTEKVHKVEHRLYSKAIAKVLKEIKS
ncbi:MAG: phosphoribosylglycinamide formyltransferase [Bdellovibrionota bacterium]